MMEEIQGINQQHTRILQQFIVFVQKQTYIITEGEDEGKYQDFEEVMQDVFAYYVDFRKYAVKKNPNIKEIYKIDSWARKKTFDIINKYA